MAAYTLDSQISVSLGTGGSALTNQWQSVLQDSSRSVGGPHSSPEPVEDEYTIDDSAPAQEDTDSSSDRYGLKAFTKPERVSLNHTISYDEYILLLKGFSPRDMDDRWLVNCTKLDSETRRGVVHLYRSWTGYEDLRGEFFQLKGAEPEDFKAPYVVFDRLWFETDRNRRGETNGDQARQFFVTLLRNIMDVTMIDRDQTRTMQ